MYPFQRHDVERGLHQRTDRVECEVVPVKIKTHSQSDIKAPSKVAGVKVDHWVWVHYQNENEVQDGERYPGSSVQRYENAFPKM